MWPAGCQLDQAVNLNLLKERKCCRMFCFLPHLNNNVASSSYHIPCVTTVLKWPVTPSSKPIHFTLYFVVIWAVVSWCTSLTRHLARSAFLLHNISQNKGLFKLRSKFTFPHAGLLQGKQAHHGTIITANGFEDVNVNSRCLFWGPETPAGLLYVQNMGLLTVTEDFFYRIGYAAWHNTMLSPTLVSICL